MATRANCMASSGLNVTDDDYSGRTVTANVTGNVTEDATKNRVKDETSPCIMVAAFEKRHLVVSEQVAIYPVLLLKP